MVRSGTRTPAPSDHGGTGALGRWRAWTTLGHGGWPAVRALRGAALRTDLPRYRVYRHGELVDEPADLHRWWREDLVGFLLGCSFTFENALLQAGVPIRHVEAGCNVPMYRTTRACEPAGIFRGP